MEHAFYIVLHTQTVKGPESFGRFFIGHNKITAYALFQKLKGCSHVSEDNILFMELVELRDTLPVNIKMISCSLDELADNCRTITREVFKLVNLTGP